MWLPSDKFSALAGLVRKYVPALKPGYMAAYGSLRFCECLSFGRFIILFCEDPWTHDEDESSAEDRLVHSTHGRNLWLVYDDARLTAAVGLEKRYEAKARQIALGIRMLQHFKIELFP